MQRRFVREYGLSDYDAEVLTGQRDTAELFDGAVRAGGDAKRVCNLLTQTGLKLANERGRSVGELGIDASRLAALAGLVEDGTISATAAGTVFEAMVDSDDAPQAIAERLNLVQTSDAGQLEALVDEVIAANPKAVEDVRSGGKKSKKARGFLLGQVMQKSGGQANPRVVGQILDRKL